MKGGFGRLSLPLAPSRAERVDRLCQIRYCQELLAFSSGEANVSVSLATVYNTLHQFTEVGLLQQVAIDSSKCYFDTNNTEHHHYYVEGRHELINIPPTNVVLGKTPEPPEG
jgi:Fur family transcriptional regulator, iron response regulator